MADGFEIANEELGSDENESFDGSELEIHQLCDLQEIRESVSKLEVKAELDHKNNSIAELRQMIQPIEQSLCSKEEQIRAYELGSDENETFDGSELEIHQLCDLQEIRESVSKIQEMKAELDHEDNSIADLRQMIQSIEQSLCSKEEQIRAYELGSDENESFNGSELEIHQLECHLQEIKESVSKLEEVNAELEHKKNSVAELRQMIQSVEQSLCSKVEQMKAFLRNI